MSAKVNAQSDHVHAPPPVNVAPLEVNVQPHTTALAPTAIKGATNVNASFKPPNKVHYCINTVVINLYLNMVYDVGALLK